MFRVTKGEKYRVGRETGTTHIFHLRCSPVTLRTSDSLYWACCKVNQSQIITYHEKFE